MGQNNMKVKIKIRKKVQRGCKHKVQ